MPHEILALAPLPSFLAAVFIGCGILAGRIRGEPCERLTSRVALHSAGISLLLTIAAIALKISGNLDDRILLCGWLKSGSYRIDLDFLLDGLSLTLAGLFALLSVAVLRFSINYMHREPGFHRFFLLLSLFTSAMLLLATAGNATLAFIGWELAGVCSYLLIAYNFDRPVAAANATFAFVTNRIGDAGFVLGIVFAFLWTGGIGWMTIAGDAAHLQEWQAGILSCCFLLAAIAKSAQVPLAPWLARAMEGPTPSSAIFYGAVMVHAGVYLVLRLQPLFEQAPLAMHLMAFIGLLTAIYGFWCGLAQTDVKSALIFSASAQVGLMLFTAGLGFWRLALWQLCAHALFRGYQFLNAPSLMHRVVGTRPHPVPPWLARGRFLYVAALQRFWLDNLGDWLIAKPLQGLGADLHSFDRQIVEPVFGLPAPSSSLPATLADSEPHRKPGHRPGVSDVPKVRGLPGKLVLFVSNAMHWFEERLVLQGTSGNLTRLGRKLGGQLNRIEAMLSRPRYLVMLIFLTLLAVF